MKHIKTVNKANLKETAAKGGCGRCQTSCQSACKKSFESSRTNTGAFGLFEYFGGKPPYITQKRI